MIGNLNAKQIENWSAPEASLAVRMDPTMRAMVDENIRRIANGQPRMNADERAAFIANLKK